MANAREDWLGLTIEDPIDPDLAICDPHHHLWDINGDRYLLDELLQDIGGGHNVVKTVFVECQAMYRQSGPVEMQPVGETEFVAAVASENAGRSDNSIDVCAGIVGFADFTLGESVAPVLEAHVAASEGRFRGIRHACPWDASPDIRRYRNAPQGLLLDSKYREGFACLQSYGLSYEAWLYHTQLSELADLAKSFPDVSIILNHVGGLLGIGPYVGKREEVYQEWVRGISELAECPNVTVKLGGLGMSMCGFAWHKRSAPPASEEMAEAMSPYYLFCVEKFGPERCMFESNFPVDKVSGSYTVLWNAFKRVAKGFSASELGSLFHDTAVRVYRL